jgi:hypothetical protein
MHMAFRDRNDHILLLTALMHPVGVDIERDTKIHRDICTLYCIAKMILSLLLPILVLSNYFCETIPFNTFMW